jgi:hypothetical protein
MTDERGLLPGVRGVGLMIHATVPIEVWADVDSGIADTVCYLNTIPGVRTFASCQGTLGEGGPEPYGPQVMASWPAEQADRLNREFDVKMLGEGWGYLYPKAEQLSPEIGLDTWRRRRDRGVMTKKGIRKKAPAVRYCPICSLKSESVPANEHEHIWRMFCEKCRWRFMIWCRRGGPVNFSWIKF